MRKSTPTRSIPEFVVISFAVLTAASAVLAADRSPPATQESADFWLDRMIADLSAVRANPPVQWAYGERTLLTILMESRGSQSDKARILEFAREQERQAANAKPDEVFELLFKAADFSAIAGDVQTAHRLLPRLNELKEKAKQPRPQDTPFPGARAFMVEYAMIDLRAMCGDMDPKSKGSLKWAQSLMLLRPADAAESLKAAVRDSKPPFVPPPGSFEAGNLPGWIRITEMYVIFGDIAGARKIAESITDPRYRAEALIVPARGFHKSGDRNAYRQCMDESLQAVEKLQGYPRTIAVRPVMNIASDLGDRDAFAKAAEMFVAATGLTSPPYFDCAYLSRGYAAVGDQAAARKWAEKAASIVERPEDRLAVARAYARLADRPVAEEQIRLAKTSPGWKQNDTYYDFEEIADDYADAGDFADAIALIRREFPGDWQNTVAICDIARREALAGKFDDATALVKNMTGNTTYFHRLRVLREVARKRAQRGDFTALAKWIDSFPSATDRSWLNVTVAQHLLGIEGKGLCGILFRS